MRVKKVTVSQLRLYSNKVEENETIMQSFKLKKNYCSTANKARTDNKTMTNIKCKSW